MYDTDLYCFEWFYYNFVDRGNCQFQYFAAYTNTYIIIYCHYTSEE